MTKIKTKYDSNLIVLKRERLEVKRLRRKVKATKEAIEIVQTISKQMQESVHKQIASVVSKCLTTVFDDAYEFQIVFEKKRSRTEARLTFVRNGEELDPLSAVGGGVVDVASFALRLACILISRPKLRHLVVLDEPFRHLHADLRPVAAQMLKTLAEETKTQFIVISPHLHEIEVGKVIRL